MTVILKVKLRSKKIENRCDTGRNLTIENQGRMSANVQISVGSAHKLVFIGSGSFTTAIQLLSWLDFGMTECFSTEFLDHGKIERTASVKMYSRLYRTIQGVFFQYLSLTE